MVMWLGATEISDMRGIYIVMTAKEIAFDYYYIEISCQYSNDNPISDNDINPNP